MLCTQTFPSPLGPLALYANADDHLVGLFLPAARWPLVHREAATVRETPVLARTAAQLAEYFAGTRREFDVALAGAGTAFQQVVWRGLVAIPYGETRSYGDLARAIGKPAASRAVGAANGKNPISIIVPCHRVIGTSGDLTGYGGGMDAKRWLLAHEGRAFQLGWTQHLEAAR